MSGRFASAHPFYVFDDLRDCSARLGEGGRVRGDGDAGMVPERVRVGKWLCFENVEVGVREPAVIERAKEVGYHNVSAARDIDDTAASPHHRKSLRIEH